MDLKYLIVLVFIASAYAQVVTESSLSCTFSTTAVGYVCNLHFNNTQGNDNFTSIGGVHLEGMTNADVVAILSTTGRTLNVPQIVCNSFPNLEYFDLTNLRIQIVTENSFGGCSRLRWLRLWNNNIAQLPANAFASNVQLTYLDLDNNWLSEIPVGIFAPLVNLETLELSNNALAVIPDDAFATLGNFFLTNSINYLSSLLLILQQTLPFSTSVTAA